MGDDHGSVTPYGQYRAVGNLRGDEENQERGLTTLNANRKEAHIPEVMGLRLVVTPLGVNPVPALTFVLDGYAGAFAGLMLPYGFDNKIPSEKFAMNLNEASVAVQSNGFHAKMGFMPTFLSVELPFLNGYGANYGDTPPVFISNSFLFNAVPFYHLGGNLGYGGDHVDTTFHVYMGSDKVRPKTNVPSFVWSLATKPVPEFNFTSHLMAGPEGEESDHWRFTLDLVGLHLSSLVQGLIPEPQTAVSRHSIWAAWSARFVEARRSLGSARGNPCWLWPPARLPAQSHSV